MRVNSPVLSCLDAKSETDVGDQLVLLSILGKVPQSHCLSIYHHMQLLSSLVMSSSVVPLAAVLTILPSNKLIMGIIVMRGPIDSCELIQIPSVDMP